MQPPHALAPPSVPLPIWQKLLRAALALRDLEPWRWMREDDVFGFIHPEGRQLVLCSVLGEKSQPPALTLYRGEAGARYLFREHEDPGRPTDPDTSMTMDGLMVEFVPRRELDPPDLHILQKVAVPVSGKKAKLGLPRCRSYLPAHLPWYLDAAEASLLTTALELAQAFVSLVERDHDFYGDRPYEEVPLYRRVGDQADSPWKLDWHTLDLSRPPAVPPIRLPGPLLERLRRLPAAEDKVWQVGTDFPPTEIHEAPRPYHPRAVLLADEGSGRLLAADLLHPNLPETQVVGQCLARELEKAGHRPAALVVGSPALAEALWPILEALGIRLRYLARPAAVESVKEFLREKFGQAHPPASPAVPGDEED